MLGQDTGKGRGAKKRRDDKSSVCWHFQISAHEDTMKPPTRHKVANLMIVCTELTFILTSPLRLM